MLKNYFKTLLRNMQKNKLHTGINVIGMAVAFTCSIILLLFVYFQFSFDTFHKNKNSLFEVYNQTNGPQGIEISSTMGYPVAPTLKAEGIGVEKATRFKAAGSGVRYKDKELDLQTYLVDNDFFSMFSFPVLKGNNMSPLSDLGNIVITEDAAKKLFGTENPIGKSVSINISGEWKSLIVSSVLKELPKNSTIKFDLLARPELSADYAENKEKWNNQHHSVYVQLSSNTLKIQVERRLCNLTRKYKVADPAYLKNKGYRPDENGDMFSMRLLPVAEVHFNSAVNSHATSKSFLHVLILVSFVIIIIACFNFINLNIGLSFTRTKEIGIRKCLGAGLGDLASLLSKDFIRLVMLAVIIACRLPGGLPINGSKVLPTASI